MKNKQKSKLKNLPQKVLLQGFETPMLRNQTSLRISFPVLGLETGQGHLN